jgi:glycosyltransferase involved in cell wall biosynthesis
MARPQPQVSVVVPCFQSARFVERSVQSALAQTESDLEVVVVDNASDDATVEIARRIAREDRRVRVEVNEENLGPVRNWRRGLALARGEHACLLFSDDWYEPSFVADTLRLLRSDPGLGFVYSPARIVFETPDLKPIRTEMQYRLAEPPIRPSEDFLAEIFERGMLGVPVSPCAALWRREELARWLDAEIPDPHGAGYLAHGAGPDLWTYLQACQAHPRFGHLAEPRVNFSAHGDNLTFKPGIRAAYALARLAFLEERRPFVDGSAARAHAWLALASDRRRVAAEDGIGLGGWLELGRAVQDQAVLAARDPEVDRAVAEAAARDPRDVPGLPASVFEPLPPIEPGSPYRVTAIVSAFKATRFLRGCLEDLLDQTLHARSELEILVVDTGSPEDEASIVREFQARSPHIRYLRTEDRRTLYAAWNLGILAARGPYLTNANADDRHRADGLERLADALDRSRDAALVYADQIWTPVPNERFALTTSRQRGCWAQATPRLLRTHCMVGPQPMWRREIHARYGLFDPTFSSAGDWEFWLRIGARERLLHLDEVLGLYFVNREGLEHSHPASRSEAERVRERYGVAPWESGAGSFAAAWEPPGEAGRPLASIVVLAGPSGDLFPSALASAALQTERDLEIVVVETDPRLEAGNVVSRLRARRPGKRVRLLRHRGGATSARNAGIEAAAGRFILPLAPDDLVEPAFLEVLLAQLAAEPAAAVAFGDRRTGSGAGVETAGPLDEAALGCGAPVARSALYHRNVFAGVGSFDPALSGGEEDRDLWVRCATRGLRAVHADAPLYFSAAATSAPRARTA